MARELLRDSFIHCLHNINTVWGCNLFERSCKGRCTYDVHTVGGGRVEPKEDVVREVA